MRCPRCHAENREGRRFCGGCDRRSPARDPSCSFLSESNEQFCGGCGARLPIGGDIHCPGTRLSAERAVRSERRQLTVMFCDLVGSTALSQRLDPEDWRTSCRDYQRTAVPRSLTASKGTIAQYLGDGRARLLRLSAGARGRCAPRGAGRTGSLSRRFEPAMLLAGSRIAVTASRRIGIHTGLVVVRRDR